MRTHKAQLTDPLPADKTRTHISLALNMYKVSVMAARRVHTNLHTHTRAYTSEQRWRRLAGRSMGGEKQSHTKCALLRVSGASRSARTQAHKHTHAQIKQ